MFPANTPRNRIKAAALLAALALPITLVIGATPFTPPPGAAQIPVVTKPLAAAAKAEPAAPLRQVAVLRAKTENWPERLEASGNVMPWHESRIGTEVSGLRLASVLVNEGDLVKKGQVLARFDTASVETDLDVANAQRVEAEAVLAQASATLERANRLAPSGGVSRQELTLYETQKHTAEARLNAARAQVKRQQIKMELATVNAPDDGLISSASALEGSIVQGGSELFRLIRQGRLEWRAEVRGDMLLKLAAGQEVVIHSPLGNDIKGRVRRISPTIDIATRNGYVYVDLPQGTDMKSGLSVTGSFNLGKSKALVIPSAALLRQGKSSQVLAVDADGKIEMLEVTTGRTRDDWVEILGGLDDQTPIVARNLKGLKDGDLVTLSTKTADNGQP
ncbi:efflux RND transporter periplasmic adaptor subunit [Quatrionicoccus australiensis]|uniref:efflux RND transporter periplasmic adaptor subunit n=1 Tax=Quatrionicoccus australiensis TaxID=138118 RepID=UPI001CF9B7EB|nr:efflux RND transporter periplasmic adaptor subunit [Quatrionicoccus australiensis]MCB4361845.1 efflux RND transporter periplasmic adaptor subunit [Quatrionicoccus australiensis]